jgi:hypothetical protein
MKNVELMHELLYGWEPKDNPNDGAYHIYDKPLSTPEIRVIQDNKYLCGLEVTDKLHNFTALESMVHPYPALDQALCSICKERLETQFPLIK